MAALSGGGVRAGLEPAITSADSVAAPKNTGGMPENTDSTGLAIPRMRPINVINDESHDVCYNREVPLWGRLRIPRECIGIRGD